MHDSSQAKQSFPGVLHLKLGVLNWNKRFWLLAARMPTNKQNQTSQRNFPTILPHHLANKQLLLRITQIGFVLQVEYSLSEMLGIIKLFRFWNVCIYFTGWASLIQNSKMLQNSKLFSVSMLKFQISEHPGVGVHPVLRTQFLIIQQHFPSCPPRGLVVT